MAQPKEKDTDTVVLDPDTPSDEAQPGDGVHAEPGMANVAPDDEVKSELPASEASDPLTPFEQSRINVEEANNAAKPGQTVVRNTAGDATVVGHPFTETSEVATLTTPGASCVIVTPLGKVTVGYDVDPEGVAEVAISTWVERPDNQRTADAVVLRGVPNS